MPSTERMLELTAKHRWLSRLTAGCVFQWVKQKPKILFVYYLLLTVMGAWGSVVVKALRY
jgi:hypothetical protein